MKLVSSKLCDNVIEIHHLKIGTFYFFDNLVIAEIHEGIHIDFKSSQEFFRIAKVFFSNEKPFGFISNRINNFSVSPLDFANYNLKLENIKAFCAITYGNYYDKMNIEIEKRFYTEPFYSTNEIEDAVNWTTSMINNGNKATA